jgi:hypothetical protein
MQEASIAPYVANISAFIEGMGIAFPIVLIVLSLIVGLFGRRLSDLVRVVLLFAIGFVASVYWLAPMVATVVPGIPGFAIGIAVGLFAAVMSRLIYNLVYVGCIGFDVYNICFRGLFLVELTSLTQGNFTTSVTVAFVATLVALGLRKYLEMIITAAAGGIGVAYFANQIYEYSANMGMEPMTAIILVGAVLAIPFFLFQFRNRVLY